MRVLFVNHTSVVSGAEHSLLALLEGMPPETVAGLACPAGPLAEMAQRRGITIHLIRGTAGSLRLHPWHTSVAVAEMALSGLEVARAARRSGAMVIHSNSLRGGLIVVIANRLHRRGFVAHVRDCLPDSAAARLIHRQIAGAADEVVAVSRYVAGRFQIGLRDRMASIRVVDEPIDFALFRGGLRSSDDPRPHDAPLLLLVGQISPWKGHDTAIRALQTLRLSRPNARLQIVGDVKFSGAGTRLDNRSYLMELRRLVERLGLVDAVEFTGERDDVPQVMAQADILLVPSTEEPFGRTVVEAMAVETPVIATNIGGPAEVIDDGLTGLLVPPGDAAAWSEAIGRILGHPEWAREMSHRAIEIVHRRFATERHVAAMTAIYESALRRSLDRGRC